MRPTCASGWPTRSRPRSALAEGMVEIEDVDSGAIDHLLRALRVPALRHLDARARAADVLLQLAPRRLPALHRPRLADGDRPGADRAGPVADAERRRDPALVRHLVELLRPDDAGDRRALRDRHGHARGTSCRRRRRTASCAAPTATAIYISYRNRYGRRRSYTTTFEGIVPNLERRYKETDSEYVREKIEEYMSVRPCPECDGARLRPESLAVRVGGLGDPRGHAHVGAALDRVVRRARADRHRARRSRG